MRQSPRREQSQGGVFGNQTTANNASAWILDVDAETTTISCYYSNTRTYLGIDTDENLALNASYSGTLWTKEGSSYYTTYNGIKYYLTYKFNAWRALPKERVRFNMSNYYMYIYSTSYVRRSGTPNDNGPYDFYHDSQGRYYGFYNNTKCYLRNNNGTVQISTTIGSAALFVREGDTLYTQSGNDKLFLMYNGSGNNNSNNNWSVRIAETITYAISDGEGHYIRVTGTTTSSYESVDNVEDATKFTFSSTTSGTISTKVGNTTYYLRNNGGTLQVSTTSTTWTINGYSISNGGYYLKYNNGNWTLSNTAPASDYYVAKSGASYMGYSGTNVVVTTEDADNLLLFSSVPAQDNNTNITIAPTGCGRTPRARRRARALKRASSHPAAQRVYQVAEPFVADRKVVVRDLEHVFAGAGHLALGVVHALLDHFARIGAAALEALAQILHGRRIDEYVDVADLERICVGKAADMLADLRRALHVYVEDHGVALCEHFDDRRLEGAVVVVVDLRVLQECAFADQRLEALLRQEVVVEAVLLLAARRARRAAYGVHYVVVLL